MLINEQCVLDIYRVAQK